MTLNDFYLRVLSDLGVTAAEETANAADRNYVAERYAHVYEMLRKDDLVSWGKTSDIPDFAIIPLSIITGSACAKGFGLQPGDIQSGMVLLRQLQAKRYVSHPVHNEYF